MILKQRNLKLCLLFTLLVHSCWSFDHYFVSDQGSNDLEIWGDGYFKPRAGENIVYASMRNYEITADNYAFLLQVNSPCEIDVKARCRSVSEENQYFEADSAVTPVEIVMTFDEEFQAYKGVYTLPEGISQYISVNVIVCASGALGSYYYNNTKWNDPISKRVQIQQNYLNFYDRVPSSGVSYDFSASYWGRFYSSQDQDVKFAFNVDDHFKFYFEEKLYVQELVTWGHLYTSETIQLEGGKYYDYDLQWRDTGGNAYVQHYWLQESNSIAWIPMELFYMCSPYRWGDGTVVHTDDFYTTLSDEEFSHEFRTFGEENERVFFVAGRTYDFEVVAPNNEEYGTFLLAAYPQNCERLESMFGCFDAETTLVEPQSMTFYTFDDFRRMGTSLLIPEGTQEMSVASYRVRPGGLNVQYIRGEEIVSRVVSTGSHVFAPELEEFDQMILTGFIKPEQEGEYKFRVVTDGHGTLTIGNDSDDGVITSGESEPLTVGLSGGDQFAVKIVVNFNEGDTRSFSWEFSVSSGTSQFVPRQLLWYSDYLLTGSHLQLEDCDENCTLCTDSGPVPCEECKDDLLLSLVTGECLEECPKDLYTNEDERKCIECGENCSSCTTSQCLQCDEDFPYLNLSRVDCVDECERGTYLDEQERICELCAESCATCRESEFCESCSEEYPFKRYITTEDEEEKLMCVQECPEGTYTDHKSQLCLNCDEGCAECYQAGSCTSCSDFHPFFVYLENESGDVTCHTGCPDGTYAEDFINEEGREEEEEGEEQEEEVEERNFTECLRCDDECATCTRPGSCWTCSSEFPLFLRSEDDSVEGSCLTQCVDGTYEHENECLKCDAMCETCTQSGSCLTCARSHPLFKSNNQDSDEESEDEEEEGTCHDVCPDGTYQFEELCLDCSPECETCTRLGSCRTCSTDYPLFLDLEEANEEGFCLDECPAGTYVNNNRCFGCDDKCATCSNAETCRTCSETHPSFRASEENALEGTCHDVCPDGTYQFEQSCLDCSPECETCTGLGSCRTCSTDYPLFLDLEEENEEGFCLDECPAGTYVNNNRCSGCDDKCATCSNAETCRTCSESHPLFRESEEDALEGTCHVSCPDGSYEDLLTDEDVCLSCPTGCATCRSATICNSCEDSHPYFVGDSERWNQYDWSCHTQIVDGFYVSKDSPFTLIDCSEECQTCAAGTNTSCLTCSSSHPYLERLSPESKQCHDNCPDGTYTHEDTSTCRSCSQDCLTCIDRDVCTSCPVEKPFLIEVSTQKPQHSHTCNEFVPEGFFVPDGETILQECHESCKLCVGPSENDCVLCPGDRYQYFPGEDDSDAGSHDQDFFLRFDRDFDHDFDMDDVSAEPHRCEKVCPKGSYLVRETKSCEYCNDTCATCEDETTCVSCSASSPFLLSGSRRYPELDDTCHGSVLDGTYIKNNSALVDCHDTCQTCVSGSEMDCSSCPGGDYRLEQPLDSTSTFPFTCQSECDNGFATSSNTSLSCRRCVGGCSTCFGLTATNCLSCPDDSVLKYPDFTCTKECAEPYEFNQTTKQCECTSGISVEFFETESESWQPATTISVYPRDSLQLRAHYSSCSAFTVSWSLNGQVLTGDSVEFQNVNLVPRQEVDLTVFFAQTRSPQSREPEGYGDFYETKHLSVSLVAKQNYRPSGEIRSKSAKLIRTSETTIHWRSDNSIVNFTFEWTISPADVLVLTNTNGLNDRKLKVEVPASVADGTEFEFSVLVTDAYGSTTTATSTFAVNEVPYGADLLISPPSGEELGTSFTFDWTSAIDDDQPLQYVVYRELSDGQRESVGSGQSFIRTLSRRNDSDLVNFVLRVSDAYGDYSESRANVIVTPFQGSEEEKTSQIDSLATGILDDAGSQSPAEVSGQISELSGALFSTSSDPAEDSAKEEKTELVGKFFNAIGSSVQNLDSSDSAAVQQTLDTVASISSNTDYLSDSSRDQVLGIFDNVLDSGEDVALEKSGSQSIISGLSNVLVGAISATQDDSENEESADSDSEESTSSDEESRAVFDQVDTLVEKVYVAMTGSLGDGPISLESPNLTAVFDQALLEELGSNSDQDGGEEEDAAQIGTVSFPANFSSNFPDQAGADVSLKFVKKAFNKYSSSSDLKTGGNVVEISLNVGAEPLNVNNLTSPFLFQIPVPELADEDDESDSTTDEEGDREEENETDSAGYTLPFRCLYWDKSSQSFSSEGCDTVDVQAEYVTCACTHMTEFASEVLAETKDLLRNSNLDKLDDFSAFANLNATNAIGIYVSFSLLGGWAMFAYLAKKKDEREQGKLKKRWLASGLALSAGRRNGGGTGGGLANFLLGDILASKTAAPKNYKAVDLNPEKDFKTVSNKGKLGEMLGGRRRKNLKFQVTPIRESNLSESAQNVLKASPFAAFGLSPGKKESSLEEEDSSMTRDKETRACSHNSSDIQVDQKDSKNADTSSELETGSHTLLLQNSSSEERSEDAGNVAILSLHPSSSGNSSKVTNSEETPKNGSGEMLLTDLELQRESSSSEKGAATVIEDKLQDFVGELEIISGNLENQLGVIDEDTEHFFEDYPVESAKIGSSGNIFEERAFGSENLTIQCKMESRQELSAIAEADSSREETEKSLLRRRNTLMSRRSKSSSSTQEPARIETEETSRILLSSVREKAEETSPGKKEPTSLISRELSPLRKMMTFAKKSPQKYQEAGHNDEESGNAGSSPAKKNTAAVAAVGGSALGKFAGAMGKSMSKKDQQIESEIKKTLQWSQQLNKDETHESDPKLKKKKTPLAYLKEEHSALGIVYKSSITHSRVSRVTILFATVLGQMFVCGIFYDESSDANSYAAPTFWDALARFTLTDFLIAILSGVFMIPVAIILGLFFTMKQLDPEAPFQKQREQFMKNKKKLKLAYGITLGWWLVCAYAITIFSLSFSPLHSYQWMITFFIGTLYDMLIGDPLKIIIKALVLLLLGNHCGACGDFLAAKLAFDMPALFSPPAQLSQSA